MRQLQVVRVVPIEQIAQFVAPPSRVGGGGGGPERVATRREENVGNGARTALTPESRRRRPGEESNML